MSKPGACGFATPIHLGPASSARAEDIQSKHGQRTDAGAGTEGTELRPGGLGVHMMDADVDEDEDAVAAAILSSLDERGRLENWEDLETTKTYGKRRHVMAMKMMSCF